MPISSVISLPLLIKLTMGQLLLFLPCNSFFSCVGGILVINHFSLLLIDRYILAIQQIITHKGAFAILFLIYSIHNNRKWLKQPQSHFHCNSSPKSPFLCSKSPPQKFQVPGKISTVESVVPDYLFISTTMVETTTIIY